MQQQRNLLLYIVGRNSTAETYDYLQKLLPACTQLGYHIVIVNQTIPFPAEFHAIATQYVDIELITLALPTTASWLLRVRTLIAFLHELQPTVVHLLSHCAETDRDCQIAIWLAHASLQRVMSIATIPPNKHNTGILATIDRIIGQRALRAMHTILVPTTTSKQHIQSHYRLLSTAIEVIPIGIDTAHYALHQFNSQTRADYHLPTHGLIIAAIGALIPHHGHALLIAAMRHVWQQYPNTHLVIIGDGKELANLQQRAQQSQQPNHIHFLASLSDERRFLALIDIYVQPSLHAEMSFHLLHAMALERPVIVSAIPNLQEVIEANASGLLVRPNDADAIASAILRLCNDHALRVTIAINARTRVIQRYQVAQWHQRTLECYRIKSPPPNRS